jgi:hypothetical protein
MFNKPNYQFPPLAQSLKRDNIVHQDFMAVINYTVTTATTSMKTVCTVYLIALNKNNNLLHGMAQACVRIIFNPRGMKMWIKKILLSWQVLLPTQQLM